MSASARSLEGRLAIITGASRGIGAAIAAKLASKGCNLILNYTSASSASRIAKVADDITAAHRISAYVVQADIGDPSAPETILSAAREHFPSLNPAQGRSPSSPTISLIINNAGVAGNEPLGTPITPEEFHRQYNINVLGPLLLVQACMPHLPTNRSGRIVNVSSVSSSLGFPTQSVYGGTKAALEAMTRTWSRELNDRATVNAVNPGPVQTDMYGTTNEDFAKHMLNWKRVAPGMEARREWGDDGDWVKQCEETGGRNATADEIAGVVGMLCSAEGAWCTGSVICANGGLRFSL